MYVFRIHIRPSGTADMVTTFDYCLRNGVLGVGWRTPSNVSTKNWDQYFKEASEEHQNLNICKYIQKWVGPDDLVWTRDTYGQYYLGRVKSRWEYLTTEESKTKDIDIANVFRCDIKSVDLDDVPGKIVACFRASKTIQEVADTRAREYTKYLWNVIGGEQVYDVDRSKYADIFMMLDDEETEDLVFLFLQSRGWYVIPNSRKGDSMSYEFLCVNPRTGEKAGTQVKTGESTISLDDYAQHSHRSFLFQPNQRYVGKPSSMVECLSRVDLETFLRESMEWLPKSFKRKCEITGLNK